MAIFTKTQYVVATHYVIHCLSHSFNFLCVFRFGGSTFKHKTLPSYKNTQLHNCKCNTKQRNLLKNISVGSISIKSKIYAIVGTDK